MKYYLTVRKLLGHTKSGKLLSRWHPLMEKKKMMLQTVEWREKIPPQPKQRPKPTPVATSSNSNMKKRQKTQKKGKGKAQATEPYSQGYRISKIQQDFMENVFQRARTMIEILRREEAR
ncbi:hypothetical protein O181_058078 [Austropuccinia psidii MF-1]|uniref:Uncharacterized protein n=1 Tax=Austropuccinia psidii MF-1 TaxID=1389203 RepID=A0A9Q3HV44_9BASI|nr:hypothetical protein [Austropuccinia psidii MF-1]